MTAYIDEAKSLLAVGPTATLMRMQSGVSIGDDEATIRKKRKARMRSISDEALHELDRLTPLLYREL
jgi:hypothetical protein